jgi:hypothetical protein
MQSGRRDELSAQGYSVHERPRGSRRCFLARQKTRQLGFQEFRVADDLFVVLKLRQFGSVQILTELPELRVHIIEIDHTDRRLLATDDAQRFEPVPAGDKTGWPSRTMQVSGVCNPIARIDCANSVTTDAL